MKSNKIVAVISAFVTSLTALFIFGAPHAFAATATWTGGGSDTNMNTAANWGGTAPSAADDLVFPANIANRTVVNNYAAGTSFNSITFSGATTIDSNYTVSGASVVVVAGITSSMTGSFRSDQTISMGIVLGGIQTFTISGGSLGLNSTLNLSTYNLTIAGSAGSFNVSGAITGSGSITKTGANPLGISGDNSAYTGAITVAGGSLYASSANAIATSGGTTIASGADITMSSCYISTFSGNITLTGASTVPSGIYANPKINIYKGGCSGTGGYAENYGTSANTSSVTFTGNITLGSDVTFGTYSKDLTFTGNITGSYAINLLPGWGGKLIINAGTNGSTTPNGTYSPPYLLNTLADSVPGNTVGTSGNVKLTIDGTRSDINIGGGGILNGTGTVGNLSINTGAIVAPGHSPGCLVVGAGLVLNGTYEAELGGTTACTEYDQLTVTGTVSLAGSTLVASLYNNFKPKAGNTFTIISNDAADAVTGTFTGLAEGATFTVSGYVFKISYVGGDGNDVVLAVVTVPTVANTGFKLLTSSPLAIIAATTAITGGAYVLSRRYATAKIK